MTSEPIGSEGPAPSRGWWLEDAVPGRLLLHPGGRTIGEAEHVWLAWLTHNVSDLHGNADAAAGSPWGRPLVLGMLTAAVVIGLAEPAVPAEAIGPAGGPKAVDRPAWRSIRLASPVLAGDTLTAESRIERVEPDLRAGLGLVLRTIIGRNQRGDVVAEIVEERLIPGRRGFM